MEMEKKKAHITIYYYDWIITDDLEGEPQEIEDFIKDDNNIDKCITINPSYNNGILSIPIKELRKHIYKIEKPMFNSLVEPIDI